MTLLVLGASSDMGCAFIESVIDDYEMVYAHYRKMNDHLQQLKDNYGEKIVLLQADFSMESEIKGLIENLLSREETPDHIVHFPAQRIQLRKFEKTDWSCFQEGMDISVKSLAMILRVLLPTMLKKKYGRIVVMISDATNGIPPKYSADYVMIKYALLGLVKALAVEYEGKNICINGISPGFVDTKFMDEMPEHIVEKMKAENSENGELKPEKVAEEIRWLLSEDASEMNGKNITIIGEGKKIS